MLVCAGIFYFQPDGRLLGLAGGALPLCLFWFLIPGHAMIYGPHLWLLVLRDLLFRRE